jgi:hypothetical protein
MANLRRIPYTEPIPAGAENVTRKGKRFARFKDRRGKVVEAALYDDACGSCAREAQGPPGREALL